jgi:hypothetical protein
MSYLAALPQAKWSTFFEDLVPGAVIDRTRAPQLLRSALDAVVRRFGGADVVGLTPQVHAFALEQLERRLALCEGPRREYVAKQLFNELHEEAAEHQPRFAQAA